MKFKFIIFILSFVILITGFWLRFWHLEAVPAAFYHDEMDHVFTGQAISLWGTDITGNWSPWQLKPLKTLNYTSEWAPLFHGITQKLFGSSVYAARLTNPIFGLLTVLLVGLFSFRLSENKKAAVLASFLMLLNPWHVHISRMGYEGTISLFFLMLTLIGLFSMSMLKAHWKYMGLWFVGTVGSYFSYHGAKFTVAIIAIPFLYLLIKKSVKEFDKLSNSALFALLIILVLAGLFSHTLVGNKLGNFGNRSTNDTISIQMIQEMVDVERRDRIPSSIDRFVSNKFTVAANELTRRYLFTFNPIRLWVEGVEGGYQFSLVTSAYFGASIFIGFLFHIKLNYQRKNFYLLWILFILSPIATVVGSGRQALFRSGLTYILLITASAWGLSNLRSWIKSKRIQALYPLLISILILFEALWFGLNYFSRYPLLTANNHTLDGRLLARYLKNLNQDVTVVVERDPYSTAREYVFYNGLMSSLSIEERSQFDNPKASRFVIENVTITTDCPKTNLVDKIWVINGGKWQGCDVESYLTIPDAKEHTRIGIPSPLDNGVYYTVWNDIVCKPYINSKAYIRLSSLNEFQIETMNDQQFCQTWIKTEQ